MKAIFLATFLVLTSFSFFAAGKTIKQKKVETCAEVMDRVKKSEKRRLFVGFATEAVVKKVRKDFPDLQTHVIKAFSTCTFELRSGEASPSELLMITVPKIKANIDHLNNYNIKNAG